MKRIFEITATKAIKLENVKVPFQVKLLQYTINNILYKYNNKFAFPQYINLLKSELTSIIKQSNLSEDKDATELLEKAREIYKSLTNYQPDNTGIDDAIDSSLKYIMYNFTKDKLTMTLEKEMELLNELKLISIIIDTNNIQVTERIKNGRKLIEQLKTSIIAKL